MSSHALDTLQAALVEVDLLQKASPTRLGGAPSQPAITRAIGRASVVLLSGHLERYIRNVNEEAVACVNSCGVIGSQLPKRLRLLHSKNAIEDLASTSWDGDGRVKSLERFSQSETWLWGASGNGALEHGRLIRWMRAPLPREIIRYYRYWEIEDIFTSITRTAHTRKHIWLKMTEMTEMTEKRNNIAHGDLAIEATQADVQSYMKVVKQFGARSDRKLSHRLARMLSISNPW